MIFSRFNVVKDLVQICNIRKTRDLRERLYGVLIKLLWLFSS